MKDVVLDNIRHVDVIGIPMARDSSVGKENGYKRAHSYRAICVGEVCGRGCARCREVAEAVVEVLVEGFFLSSTSSK